MKARKNFFKAILFILLLLLPFWISRIILVLTNSELQIHDYFNYAFVCFKFDLKAIAIWYAPLFLFLGIGFITRLRFIVQLSRILFLLLFLAALVFNLIAIFYYPTSKTIVGIDIVKLIQGQEVRILINYAIDYLLPIVISLSSLYLAYKVFVFSRLEVPGLKSKVSIVFLSLVLLVFFARGSLKLKPLNLLDAYAVLDAEEAVSAVTPVYVLIESFGKPLLVEVDYVSEQELEQNIASDQLLLSPLETQEPNICLILIESFGKEYTGDNKIGLPSYTPFLDSLANKSIYFSNAYANGLRSVDAVASLWNGIPSFMKTSFIGSSYSRNRTTSIIEALSLKDYYSSFFHGADELSMGFKPFLMSEGLDKYYGKQQYPDEKDYDGTWGIFDGPFLQFAAKELDNQPEPWLSGIFTLSSHHPYSVPSNYDTLAEGTLPIHQSVRYTDEMLRLFFDTISNLSWFNNTVFIITADHSSVNESTTYRTYRGKYEVPMLIYSPSNFTPDEKDYPVQHIDIYPTVLQLAGINSTASYGRSLFDSTPRSIKHFDGNVYTVTSDSLSLQWNGTTKYDLFAYKKDPEQHNNLSSTYPKLGDSLFYELKLFIQKFNYKMINNDFD